MTEQPLICGNFLLSLSCNHLQEITSKQNFPLLQSGGKGAIKGNCRFTYFHFPAISVVLWQLSFLSFGVRDAWSKVALC